MSRDITIDAMIALPRLTRSSATALAERLLTAAREEKCSGLPLFIERPRSRMFIAAEALKAQTALQETVVFPMAVEADCALDNSWRSFSAWLGALAGMSEGTMEDLRRVQSLHELLFRDGLSSVIQSFEEELGKSESRLNSVADGEHEPLIAKLGGLPLFTNIKNAHTRFGDVLGIKTPMKAEENRLVRASLINLINAIKAYVVKVAAYADPDDPDSEFLSQTLLTPLSNWKDAARLPMGSVDVDDDVSKAFKSTRTAM